ncbi:MAG: hypothetical protein AABY64_13130 [Bdellovibrionota bacterium]
MKNHISFITDRKNEIEALRQQEYANAKGFVVDLETLKWKSSDDESFVMAAESKGQLVSTMRGEVINELAVLEKKLECPWNFPMELGMPVLLLSRAATLSSYRNVGLNLVLRYWFIRLAMAHNIHFMIGTFMSGSPRENTLQEMGYQFFENKLGWQESTYRSLGPVTVAVLNLQTDGEKALQYCLRRVPEGIKEYQFNQEFPAIRYVRNL